MNGTARRGFKTLERQRQGLAYTIKTSASVSQTDLSNDNDECSFDRLKVDFLKEWVSFLKLTFFGLSCEERPKENRKNGKRNTFLKEEDRFQFEIESELAYLDNEIPASPER